MKGEFEALMVEDRDKMALKACDLADMKGGVWKVLAAQNNERCFMSNMLHFLDYARQLFSVTMFATFYGYRPRAG